MRTKISKGGRLLASPGSSWRSCWQRRGSHVAEVYICNVLKCRPPGNRDPAPGEIASCKDYLDEQIEIVDPLVIITLGRYSMSRYFPNLTISRIHGQYKRIDGRFYVPMYHPAAALHQQALREVILDDFRALPAILNRDGRRQRPPTQQSHSRRVPLKSTQPRFFELKDS